MKSICMCIAFSKYVGQLKFWRRFNGVSAMSVAGGSGQLDALELVVVLSVLCCGKCAGEQWLIQPRIHIAIGLECMPCFN